MNWESSLGTQFSSFERLRKLKLLLIMQRRSLAKGVPEWGAQGSRQSMDALWDKIPVKGISLAQEEMLCSSCKLTWGSLHHLGSWHVLGMTSAAELCCFSDVVLYNLLMYTHNALAEAGWHLWARQTAPARAPTSSWAGEDAGHKYLHCAGPSTPAQGWVQVLSHWRQEGRGKLNVWHLGQYMPCPLLSGI